MGVAADHFSISHLLVSVRIRLCYSRTIPSRVKITQCITYEVLTVRLQVIPRDLTPSTLGKRAIFSANSSVSLQHIGLGNLTHLLNKGLNKLIGFTCAVPYEASVIVHLSS